MDTDKEGNVAPEGSVVPESGVIPAGNDNPEGESKDGCDNSKEKLTNYCEGEVADVDKACFAKHAHYADYAKQASSANHAEHADSATSTCYADKSDRACYAKIAEYAKKTDHANDAKRAEFADHAKDAKHAEFADYALKAEIADEVNNVDTTKFFWINGNPNSSQIAPNTALLVQKLPLNVPPGSSVNIDRIRCSLGFYTPIPSGLHLQVFASSLLNDIPLGNLAQTTSNVVDEIPDTTLIYKNINAQMTTVVIVIAVVNVVGNIMHTDMPDSWWVGVKIA